MKVGEKSVVLAALSACGSLFLSGCGSEKKTTTEDVDWSDPQPRIGGGSGAGEQNDSSQQFVKSEEGPGAQAGNVVDQSDVSAVSERSSDDSNEEGGGSTEEGGDPKKGSSKDGTTKPGSEGGPEKETDGTDDGSSLDTSGKGVREDGADDSHKQPKTKTKFDVLKNGINAILAGACKDGDSKTILANLKYPELKFDEDPKVKDQFTIVHSDCEDNFKIFLKRKLETEYEFLELEWNKTDLEAEPAMKTFKYYFEPKTIAVGENVFNNPDSLAEGVEYEIVDSDADRKSLIKSEYGIVKATLDNTENGFVKKEGDCLMHVRVPTNDNDKREAIVKVLKETDVKITLNDSNSDKIQIQVAKKRIYQSVILGTINGYNFDKPKVVAVMLADAKSATLAKNVEWKATNNFDDFSQGIVKIESVYENGETKELDLVVSRSDETEVRFDISPQGNASIPPEDREKGQMFHPTMNRPPYNPEAAVRRKISKIGGTTVEQSLESKQAAHRTALLAAALNAREGTLPNVEKVSAAAAGRKMFTNPDALKFGVEYEIWDTRDPERGSPIKSDYDNEIIKAIAHIDNEIQALVKPEQCTMTVGVPTDDGAKREAIVKALKENGVKITYNDSNQDWIRICVKRNRILLPKASTDDAEPTKNDTEESKAEEGGSTPAPEGNTGEGSENVGNPNAKPVEETPEAGPKQPDDEQDPEQKPETPLSTENGNTGSEGGAGGSNPAGEGQPTSENANPNKEKSTGSRISDLQNKLGQIPLGPKPTTDPKTSGNVQKPDDGGAEDKFTHANLERSSMNDAKVKGRGRKRKPPSKGKMKQLNTGDMNIENATLNN